MAYYLINMIISLVLVLIFVYKWNSGCSVYFTVMCIMIAVANIGYWQLHTATSLEQALLGNKMTYLGGCFATLGLVMCVFYLCEITVSKYFTLVLFLISMAIYGGNLTAGYNIKIFYKSVKMVTLDNGLTGLVKEYGPMHTGFYAMLVAYYVLCIWGLVKGFRCRNKVSIKMIYHLVIALTLNMIAFFIGNRLFDYDLMPVTYNVCLIIFTFLSSRYALYDVNASVVSSLLKMETLGVISFDNDFSYIGSNDVAKKIYPPINQVFIDKKLDEKNEDLREIISWVDEIKTSGQYEGYYSSGDKHYHVTSGLVYAGKKKIGHQFSFSDCTELLILSTTDKLTGLPNRRAYEDAIEEVQGILYPKEKSNQGQLCICSFDVNGLKTVNDNQGHAAGDELIKAASECIESSFGSLGIIYRTGGDEFMGVIYADNDQLQAAIKKMEESAKNWHGEHVDSLAISVGAAGISEFPDSTVVDLAKKADARMYDDKSEYYKKTGIDRRK